MNKFSIVAPALISLAVTVNAIATFEYSPEIMAKVHHWNDNSQMVKVTPVNTGSKMTFTVIKGNHPSGMVLFKLSSNGNDTKVSYEPNICEGNTGIQLEADEHNYCLTGIGILDSKYEATRIMTILMFFKPQQYDLKLSLSIKVPLFEIPNEITPEILEEWASENKISVASPFEFAQLHSINSLGTFRSEFTWMNKLFKHKVCTSTDLNANVLRVYTTRPMALPQNLLRDVSDLIDVLKMYPDVVHTEL